MTTLLFLCLLIVGFLAACVVAVAAFFGALFITFDALIERAQKRAKKQGAP